MARRQAALTATCAAALCVAYSGAEAGYLMPAPAWEFDGDDEFERYGAALAVGDFDRDTSVEIVIARPGMALGEPGAGGLDVWGTHSLTFLLGRTTLAGDGAYDFFGTSVATGDVDADGFPDLIVGVPGFNDGGASVGAIAIHRGGPAGLDLTAWTVIPGSFPSGRFGASVAWLGDVNGDGYGDVAVGAPREDFATGGGSVHVIHGAATPPTAPAWSWSPGIRDAEAGFAVAGAGDVDDDGFDDLLVGAPGVQDTSRPTHGAAYLVRGGLGGLAAAPEWTYSPDAGNGRIGQVVAGGFDLNADGVADVAVGAPQYDPGGLPGAGRMELFFGLGASPGLPTSAGWETQGTLPGAAVGSSVGAGDVNGDGFTDLVVGAAHADVATAGDLGWVTVHPGNGAGLAPTAATVLGFGPGGEFGDRLLVVPDIDGDGRDEVLVSAPRESLDAAADGVVRLHAGLDAAVDVDGDGFCGLGPCPTLLTAGDCDDLDPHSYPGAVEICDGRDNDCDGAVPSDEDDFDGDLTRVCEGDCDDRDATVAPGRTEECDAIDHDCDGAPFGGLIPAQLWPDVDGDGWGDASVLPSDTCVGVDGWVNNGLDCDDGDPAVRPGAVELACSGRDEDCDPTTVDVADGDGDGWLPCASCVGYEGLGFEGCGDCDDRNRGANPGAGERCGDFVDQDCDGEDLPCVSPPECDQPDNLCEEDGCACSTSVASPTSALGVLLLAGLLGLRRGSRRGLVVALCAVLIPGVALAAEGDADLDTQQLRASFLPSGFLSHPGARRAAPKTFRAGALVGYELAPIVLTFNEAETEAVTAHRLSATVGGGVVPVRGLGVALSLPVYALWGDGHDGARPATGDLRLEATYALVDLEHFGFAPRVEVFFPTSVRDRFVGEPLPRALFGVVAQGDVGPLSGFVGVDLMVRKKVVTGYDVEVGNELGLTGGVRIGTDRIAGLVEAQVRGAVARLGRGGAESPAEVRAALRALPHPRVRLDVGVGFGLGEGLGAPVVRGMFGVSAVVPPGPPPPPEPPPPPPPPPPPREEPKPEPEPERIEDLELPEEPEPEPVPEPPKAEISGERIVLSERIQFRYDSDELLPVSYDVLRAVIDLLDRHPEVAHVLVEGHASAEGTVTYNWDLSTRRAASVFRYLVENGADARRLSYRGMGEAVPQAAPVRVDDPEDRDRRVELRIVRVLSEWTDEIPDWKQTAPPVPWAMDEAEEREPAPEPEPEEEPAPEPEEEPAPEPDLFEEDEAPDDAPRAPDPFEDDDEELR